MKNTLRVMVKDIVRVGAFLGGVLAFFGVVFGPAYLIEYYDNDWFFLLYGWLPYGLLSMWYESAAGRSEYQHITKERS